MPTATFFPTHLGTRPNADIIDIMTAKGLRFIATHNVTVDTGTSVTVLITTPASEVYHLRGTIQADQAGTWEFGKEPVASGGSAITAYNANDGSDNISTLVHTHTVTYTSSGTVMTEGKLTSNNNLTYLGGFIPRGSEWILASSQTYLIKFDATSTSTNVIITLDYYREE